MIELKEAIKLMKKGDIIFDGSKGMKYFLFIGRDDKLYFIHNETITFDKMRIAELENSQPDLLSESWWESKWEVWKGALE